MKNRHVQLPLMQNTGPRMLTFNRYKLLLKNVKIQDLTPNFFIWDTEKPDGTPRKWLDVSKLHSLGWKHKINLNEGIKNTYEWFIRTLTK